MTILERLKNEPALLRAAVVAVVLLFGVNLSTADVDALQQVIGLLVVGAGAYATRRQVTPAVVADARALRAYGDVQVEGHPGNPFRGG